jgi:hypothetical protein
MFSENIPERFLRQLWKTRHFSLTNLRTLDDLPLEIISPGKPNNDSGPDFLHAVLRIGNILHRGDVEIHQHNEDWFLHRHHTDPRYNSVILHVIFSSEQSPRPPVTQRKRTIPLLALDRYLIPPFRTTWQKMILDERAERQSPIPCSTVNSEVDRMLLQKWLQRLSIERMELKVRRFEERLKEMITEYLLQAKEPPPRYGEVPFGINPEELPPPISPFSIAEFRRLQIWEQLLYEGTMEALGYSKNQDPFLKLSRAVPLHFLHQVIDQYREEEKEERLTAVLFATAGLFPIRGENLDGESRVYIRQLKEIWKKIRQDYYGEILNRSDWQFFRLRPENFPTIRIGGAVHIIRRIMQHELLHSLIQIAKDRHANALSKLSLLEHIFIVEADGFWSRHFRFGEPARQPITRLIGSARVHDIVLNVIIPISMLYARIFKERDVREGILEIFEACRTENKNSIIEILNRDLLRGKIEIKSAMVQQGMLQLYKFYCLEHRCSECAIGNTLPIALAN